MDKLLFYIYIFIIFLIIITPIVMYNIKKYNIKTKQGKKNSIIFIKYIHIFFAFIMVITPFITNNIELLYINLFIWIFIIVGWYIKNHCWVTLFQNKIEKKKAKRKFPKNNITLLKIYFILFTVIPIYMCTYKLNKLLIGHIINIFILYFILIKFNWTEN